jgi:hypothetical protein
VSRKIKKMRLITCKSDLNPFGIQITVKTLTGKSLHLKVEPREKVSELKHQLARISGNTRENERT